VLQRCYALREREFWDDQVAVQVAVCDEMLAAVRAGDLHTVRVLVDAGAPVHDHLLYTWHSPLMHACMAGFFDIVLYLIEKGADPLEVNAVRLVTHRCSIFPHYCN